MIRGFPARCKSDSEIAPATPARLSRSWPETVEGQRFVLRGGGRLEESHKSDAFDGIVASVDVVPHEQVICPRDFASNLE